MSHVIPPVNSGCGRVQPGFDPDTYDAFSDTFCSVAWTYRFSTEGETHYWDWWAYVLDMGEPDPDAALPEHLDAMLPAAQDSALYCHFRWRIDAAEPVGDYDEADVQRVDDLRFQGYVGMRETGGIERPGQRGGSTFFYRSYDSLQPSSDGEGPGYCAPCRYFGGSDSISRCDWDDVRALPAQSSLVHPEWQRDYPDLFSDVHGGT